MEWKGIQADLDQRSICLIFFLFLMGKQNASLKQLKVKFVMFGDLEEEPVIEEFCFKVQHLSLALPS